MKYSVCITNYNSIDTIRRSIDSVINELKGFEVVVCDNCSNDGSREILQEYEQKGQIKLFVKESSRGKGRQIAFEQSTGQYIISGIDTDDILKPAFKEFLEIYHKFHEGYMLSFGTIHIIPRTIVEKIGGWRDLKYFEDVDFRFRAQAIGKWHEIEMPWTLVERGKNKRSPIYRIREQYNAVECAYKIGKSVFTQVKTSKKYLKPPLLVIALYTAFICRVKRIKRLNNQINLN